MDRPTADSISAAKAHQQQERAKVTAAIPGLTITDDGALVRRGLYLIHCNQRGCQFVASARSDGRAVRSLASHLIGAHMQEPA